MYVNSTRYVGLWLLLLWIAPIIRGTILPPKWANVDINPCAKTSWQLLQWPSNKQCYAIFTQGPCEDKEELYFSHQHSRAACRCSQGKVRHTETRGCHAHYSRGPCDPGQYLAIASSSDATEAECHSYQDCQGGQLYWPRTTKCYRQHSQGPCVHGELLHLNASTGETQCGCSETIMPSNYWSHEASCHEQSTTGPCIEGQIFRYNPSRRKTECVCGPHLVTNYHRETGRCYTQGTVGPCGRGQTFQFDEDSMKTTCQCLDGHVLWLLDSHCYREFTRGPCQPGYFLRAHKNAGHGSCMKHLCSQGQLYDPESNACYYVGRRGPCDNGKLWVFEKASSVRGACKCDRHLIGYWSAHQLCYEIGQQGPCDKRKVIDYNRKSGRVECRCDERRGYVGWIHGGCLRVGVSRRRMVPVSGPSRNSVGGSSFTRIHRGLTLPTSPVPLNITVSRNTAPGNNSRVTDRRKPGSSTDRRHNAASIIRTSSSSTRITVSTRARPHKTVPITL